MSSNSLLASTIGRHLSFESVFSDTSLCEQFIMYLKRSFNEDCLMFLRECRHLMTVQDPQELFSTVESICERYIKQGGSNEINISGSVRRGICGIVEKHKNSPDKVPNTLFDDVCFVVTRELKEDAFARYIRSKDFEDYVKKRRRSSSFVVRKQLCLSAQQILISKCVTDTDVKVILKLCEDSFIWEALQQTKKNEKEGAAYSYVSHKPAKTLDGNKVMLAKFTGIIPFSAEKTINAMMDVKWRKRFRDPGQTGDKFVGYHAFEPLNEHAVSLGFYTHKHILPIFKDIECTKMDSIVYDVRRQCYVWIAKSTTAYGIDADAKRDNQINFFYSTVVNHVSDNVCRYTSILQYYMGKFDNATVLKYGMKPAMNLVQDGMIKLLREAEKHEFAASDNTHRVDETLSDYLKKTNGGKTWDISDIRL
ncbi:regulator of G-protein signaling [Acrasis kona]|uniref:Regulator of G-protein signaling n=1 Tax=Acrasis kona TaxID=1008807 RepID=A0AAW2Z6N6_9EUKA